jgi:ATP synthase protein I
VSGEGSERDRRWVRQLGLLSGLGLTLVISTVLGLWGGHILDRWLGSHPLLMLTGLVLGIAAGFVNLFRAVGMLDGRRDRGRGQGEAGTDG